MTTIEIDSTRTTVFVYGSLKKGQGNHGLLRGAEELGRAEIDVQGRFIDLGWFPGVTDEISANITRVKGELYRVDEEGLRAVDCLEGHPDFYGRCKLETTEGVRTWIYRLPGASYPSSEFDEVPNGIWNPSTDEVEFYKLGYPETADV